MDLVTFGTHIKNAITNKLNSLTISSISGLQTELNNKANQTTTYTKLEIDGKIGDIETLLSEL